MPARERVTDKAPGFEGQKSAYPIESYGIKNAEFVQNYYLHHNQLVKSPGAVLYGDASATTDNGGIKSLHVLKDLLIAQRGATLSVNQYPPYWNSNAFTDVLVISKNTRLFSTFWRDRLYLSNTRDMFFFYYQDNGIAIPNVQQPIGLDAPANGIDASTIVHAAPGNVDDGDHYYMISVYDQNTNTESPCGGALPSVDGLVELSPNGFLGPVPAFKAAAGSAQQITIGHAGLLSIVNAAQTASGNRASHFIIYRSKAKLGTGLYDSFFRVPLKDGGAYDGSVLIPISALQAFQVNNFVDNTSNANLPAVSPPSNNSPPPSPSRMLASLTKARASYGAAENWTLDNYSGFRHMRFFRDQLFGVGAHSFGFTVTQEIAFSSDAIQKVTGRVSQFRDLLHGSEVYQPDYWPYRWEIGRGDGQEAIGLGVLGDVALLIFKEGSAYYLSGSSPDNFVVRIMDTQRGCVHQGTIQETPLGVITLDRSGFVLWNKIGQGQPASDDVHDVIEQIKFHYASSFYSSYDSKLKLYRCAVVTPGAPTRNGVVCPNLTFVLDLDTMQWTFEQGNEGLSRVQFSVNSNNLTQLSADAANTDSQLDVGKIFDYVGSNANSHIFDYSQQSAIKDQGGGPIIASWTSGTINFGDDQHKKRMNWIYLRAKSFGGWKVDIEVIPDYDESKKYILQDWDVLASQSQWFSSDIATDGSLLWDDGTGTLGGVWASAGQTRQVSKIPVKCIGRTFQIRITNKDTSAPNYGFAIESVSAEGCMLGR